MDDRYLFYPFSDEEDGEDALLTRAYDRWAQLVEARPGVAHNLNVTCNLLGDDAAGVMC